MAHILVIGHGFITKEFSNAVSMILGAEYSPDWCCLDFSDGIENFKLDINQKICALAEAQEKIIIVSDLFFGSPFISTLECLKSFFTPDRFRVVTGANLPMLLELCLANHDNPDDLDGLVNIAISKGKEGIQEYVIKLEEDTQEKDQPL